MLAAALAPHAEGRTPQPTTNVAAYTAGHEGLAANPVLRPGDRVQLVVTGFGRQALVTVLGTGSDTVRAQRADGTGTVRMGYVVPPDVPPGGHYLEFSGAPDAGVAEGHVAGDVRATVPVFGLFPFRTLPVTGTASGAADGEGDGSSGSLASTGVAIAALLVVAGILLGFGVVALRRGRRRDPS